MIKFNNKEFSSLLSTFTKLAQHGAAPHASISFDFDPFRLVMITEHALISAYPVADIVQKPNCTYTFNPEVLTNLHLSEGDVVLKWDNPQDVLDICNNHLKTKLKVAMSSPVFDAVPDKMESFDTPLGVLIGAESFLSIPFVFFSGKKEMMPVHFYKNKDNRLVISADDGFSIAKITTPILVKMDKLDVKIPKYIMECLYSKGSITDETPLKVGVNGFKTLFSNKTFQIYLSGLSENTSDFDTAIQQFKPRVSCEFIPKLLSTAIKPLVSILPKKDKNSTILHMRFKDAMSLSITHADVGNVDVDYVEGISKIYLEDDAKSISINMYPPAFQKYTELIDLGSAMLYADHRMVHYKGICLMGGLECQVEYIFPTIQI
jgi:hypothetical protein